MISPLRQAVFNLIGHDLTGARVLDLFAGTGSLGIEALSRGAQSALFIDHALQAIAQIKKNLDLCGCGEAAVVLRKDLRKGLPLETAQMLQKFDLVFIDPPYGKSMAPGLLKELGKGDVLGPDPIVVTEASKLDELPEVAGCLYQAKTRIHGETKIAIYAYGDSA